MALIFVVVCPRLSSKLTPNCKLDGVWKDAHNTDYLVAEFVPKQNTTKLYSEIYITYYVYNGRFRGHGIYNGTNTGAYITLARPGLGKNRNGFMICHDGRLFIEGFHPYEPQARRVFDKSASPSKTGQGRALNGTRAETESRGNTSKVVRNGTQPAAKDRPTTAVFNLQTFNVTCNCTNQNFDGVCNCIIN